MSSTRTSRRLTSGDTRACARFLATLFGNAPADAFVEIRARAARGMTCSFVATSDLATAESTIARYAQHTDVYVGVLPRRRRAGTRKDVVGDAALLWADCDTPESIAALATFVPEPSIVVASGSGENRHAYWLLDAPISTDITETVNRRLAFLLGADERCTDAARILRPPSLNHKHDPPRRVRMLACEPSRRHRLDEIIGVVDETLIVPRDALARSSRHDVDDVLLRIVPTSYVEQLTGVFVPRHRKVRCPFHEDRTPSLHVYDDAQRGWFCFGCGRGGSIYDFAALLWGCETRGAQFLALRDELLSALTVP